MFFISAKKYKPPAFLRRDRRDEGTAFSRLTPVSNTMMIKLIVIEL